MSPRAEPLSDGGHDAIEKRSFLVKRSLINYNTEYVILVIDGRVYGNSVHGLRKNGGKKSTAFLSVEITRAGVVTVRTSSTSADF